MSDVIHFAHGNGFPSPCYHQLLQRLEERFQCCYIDRIGHNPNFPVTENWHFLVDEVIDSIKKQTTKPVIGVGHSLGGVLSFVAAVEEPSLFKALVLLDSPIINRLKSNLLRLSKTLGMIDHITPAFRTRGRRQFWHTKKEALNYLHKRSLFKNFTHACLQDYIEYGMKKSEQGYSLRFDPKIEYEIYRTIPHMLHEYEGRLRVPTALIHGSRSNVIDFLDLRHMQKQYGILTYGIQGTHMFPFEAPDETARFIFKAVDAIV